MLDLSVWAILGVIFFLAFLVEAVVEYVFGAPFDHVAKLAPFRWLLMYIAMLVGVLGAFIYKFDLISLLAQFLGVPIQVTLFGLILTGCGIGRGANWLHDAVTKYFIKPVPLQ